jgi:hypothetical protein
MADNLLPPERVPPDKNLGPLTQIIYFCEYHDTEEDEVREKVTEIEDAEYAPNLKRKDLYYFLSIKAGVVRT